MAAAKAALVDQIKNLQRTDQEAKQAWWDYADNHLGGVRDPNKHEASTLAQFVTALQTGSLTTGSSRHSSSRPAASSGKGSSKGHNNNSNNATSAAAAAVTALASNPAALAALAALGVPGLQGPSAPVSTAQRLADAVKTGQRHSSHWRTSWQTYCALYGTGYNDPARYDESFLVGYLDHIGQLATTDLTNIAAEHGVTLDLEASKSNGKRAPTPAAIGDGPPAKRPRSTGAVGASSSSPAASADPEKAELVDRVKALQRSNAEAKAAWQAYCENHAQGIKDPMRHENTILQQFIDTYS